MCSRSFGGLWEFVYKTNMSTLLLNETIPAERIHIRLLHMDDVAQRLGVSQQVIARLESGEADNPTVTTLERIAVATGHRLRFKFEPARGKSPPGRDGARRARVRPAGKAGRA